MTYQNTFIASIAKKKIRFKEMYYCFGYEGLPYIG